MANLKIIHIIPKLIKRGAEKLVLDLCCELYNKKEIDVILITFKKSENIEISKRLNHIYIPSYFEPSILSKSNKEVNKLQEFINYFNPDIIHTHLWESELLLTTVNIKNAIKITHFHNNIPQLRKTRFTLRKKKLTDLYEKKIYLKNNKNHFITISKDTYNYALKTIPNRLRKNIYFLPNGIKYNLFYNKYEQPTNKIKLINIGAFDDNKNQILAIKTLEKIILFGYNASLTFLGNGLNKEKLVKYCNDHNIKNFVHFEGVVENVSYYLNQSNMYIHTAKSESFGLVIIEAMAAALPVISLDGIGNRDIIVHKQNGYILREENPETFAKYIIKLYKNDNLHKKIALNGQSTAKKYDMNLYIDKLLDIYNSSISSIN